VPVIKITLSDLEMDAVKKWARGAQLAPLAKRALLADVGYEPELPGVTHGTSGLPRVSTGNRLPGVTAGDQELPQVPEPDSGTRLALTSAGTDPEKKEEEKKKNKETRLAPLDVTTRILADLNERAGTAYRPSGKKVRELIAVRMADGFVEADFFEVHRKKCREWLGTDMARYLTFETLYSRKFEKYLGQPDVGPKKNFATTEGEKRAERWDKRKEPGYYD
jgi:uncharacterized phage protein (TIGR02220 family)